MRAYRLVLVFICFLGHATLRPARLLGAPGQTRFGSLDDIKQSMESGGGTMRDYLETFRVGETEFAVVRVPVGSGLPSSAVSIMVRAADGTYLRIMKTSPISWSLAVGLRERRLEVTQSFEGVDRPFMSFMLDGRNWERARQPDIDLGTGGSWDIEDSEDALRRSVASESGSAEIKKFSAGALSFIVVIEQLAPELQKVRVYHQTSSDKWYPTFDVGPLDGKITAVEVNGELVVARTAGTDTRTVFSMPLREVYPRSVAAEAR